MTRQGRRVLALGAVAFTIGAADAGAAIRHAAPTGSGTACTEAAPCALPVAVSGAAVDDTVRVAPGTYSVAAPIVVPRRMTIEGAPGGAAPVLQGAPLGVVLVAVDAAAGGTTIRGLRLDLPAAGVILPGTALSLAAPARVEDTTIAAPTCISASAAGVVIEDVTLEPRSAGALPAVCLVVAGADAVVRRVDVQPPAGGASLFGFGPVSLSGAGTLVEDLTVQTPGGSAVTVTGGTPAAPIVLRRARATGGSVVVSGGRAVISDSLVVARPLSLPGLPASPFTAVTAGNGADVTLSGVTAIADGPQGVAAQVAPGSTSTGFPEFPGIPGIPGVTIPAGALTIRNSVLRGDGPERGIVAFPCATPAPPGVTCTAASASVSHTNVDGVSPGVTQGAGMQSADPRFVDAAGDDYRLAADSPALDVGSPDALTGPLDVLGQTRISGPGLDLGAFERQVVPPPSPPPGDGGGTGGTTGGGAPGGGAPGGGAPGGAASRGGQVPVVVPPRDTTAPVLSNAGATPGTFAPGARRTTRARRTTFVFASTEAGAGQVRIERVLTGRRVGRRCSTRARRGRRCTIVRTAGTLRRAVVQGLNRVAFTGVVGGRRVGAGRYRAVITATDAAGNTSRAVTVTFRVVRR